MTSAKEGSGSSTKGGGRSSVSELGSLPCRIGLGVDCPDDLVMRASSDELIGMETSLC